MKGDKEKGIWLQRIGNFQWAIKVNGQVVGQMHYNEVRPYIMGRRPREELLERFGATHDKQSA